MAGKLTKAFSFNIPQRWSIAHLYQAILNNEEHVGKVDYITTLSGYVHWKLTGRKVIGIGEASGMFPIDPQIRNYQTDMIDIFDDMISNRNYTWKLTDILPEVLVAGQNAGILTEEGAALMDTSGAL